MKALVCGAAILVSLFATGTWDPVPSRSLYGLVASGALGLGIGDLFLLAAFARMGASRTLLIFGFQPLLMAVAGALFFRQSLVWSQGLALVFFILCLLTLSLERYRIEGHWEIKGLLFAFVGVLLDNGGILLTRASFDLAPALDPLQANLFRIAGALAVYFVLSLFRPLHLRHRFLGLSPRDRLLVIAAGLLGTFLSLALYLRALKDGHLALISGIVLTGPLFSALVESVIQKKRPSGYQLLAFLCLLSGMGLVFRTP